MFITIQVYLKKQEKSQINNLTLHLKQLEKEEMKNPRVSRIISKQSIILKYLVQNIRLVRKIVLLIDILFNDVLGENEKKFVLLLLLEPNELFGQPNINPL